MIQQTFQTTLPNVARHLQKRTYFCDYLMLTGIFTNPQLDRDHQQLYDRILNHYLERYGHRQLFGQCFNPKAETEYSFKLEEADQAELSLAALKDGKAAISIDEWRMRVEIQRQSINNCKVLGVNVLASNALDLSEIYDSE